MSDQSQGPGWWIASDGKWYPPDQAPAVPPPETWATPPAGPPPRSGMSTGAVIALVAVVAFVGLALLSIVALQLLGTEAESTSSKTGTPTEEADLPEGYARIDGEGVSIGAPDGWQSVSAEDFALTPEEFRQAFPDAPEGMLEQFSSIFEQGAVLVAFEPSVEFASNINVLSGPGEVPLTVIEGQAIEQLGSLGATDIERSRVDLPHGEAVRVQYAVDATMPDGSTLPAAGVQYYLPYDGRTYVVTITVNSAEDVAELAETMIETFRVE